MRRNLAKTLAALAFVSAAAVGTAAPAMAQVYFEGVEVGEVEVGVGPRWHHDHYYERSYLHHRHDWRTTTTTGTR
jgi:hypothetical protein